MQEQRHTSSACAGSPTLRRRPPMKRGSAVLAGLITPPVFAHVLVWTGLVCASPPALAVVHLRVLGPSPNYYIGSWFGVGLP